jgi:hypothetical protein
MFCTVMEDAMPELCVMECSQLPHCKDNTENWKQIFPEKKPRDHSPNSNIHVSVSDLYIPTNGMTNLLQENRWNYNYRENIKIAQRHMNVEIGTGLRPRNSFSGNT